MATVINKNKFRIFRHEHYGHAKTHGHKVWVSVDGSDDGVNSFLTYIRATYKDKPVMLSGRDLKATEITVFMYYWNREPASEADNWTADKIVEIEL